MGSEKETPHLIECGVVPQSTETEIAEGTMVIGNRLRESREAKELSQGDIEKRTGLLRCYISRVENNHTVPAVDTLEKLARALKFQCINFSMCGVFRCTEPNARG
jgi:ribosome-binding protein aMBF1 (putative translation factor)